ncbi:uncharacterized protein TNCV_1992271 [Trichonephila clavipes]|nr:uncharacterized protein TNCV_1992271 [Trichonephila clavipes]
MPLRRFRRQYEQLSQFERGNRQHDGSWVVRYTSCSSIKPLRLCCEEVLGLGDPRDFIYKKTKLRMPSEDQSSRRPPHRKKCTRTANCFISRHPGTDSTFSRDPCVISNHTSAESQIWDHGAHYVCCH